jgi:hypothetical protein
MLPLVALATLAAAAPPQQVEVRYTVTFDLGSMGDQACPITKICDCTLTYAGKGTLAKTTGSTHVYEGTWAHTDGSCTDAFMLWSPGDGKAFHHVTLDGDTVTEWMVSKGASDSRRSSGMKQAGQFWITGMKADARSGKATHTESESSSAGGIALTTEHVLQLTLPR